jgi:hypothetical protein
MLFQTQREQRKDSNDHCITKAKTNSFIIDGKMRVHHVKDPGSSFMERCGLIIDGKMRVHH